MQKAAATASDGPCIAGEPGLLSFGAALQNQAARVPQRHHVVRVAVQVDKYAAAAGLRHGQHVLRAGHLDHTQTLNCRP